MATDLLQQYSEFKKELENRLDETSLILENVSQCLRKERTDSVSAIKEKLKQNRFSIVLVGAFQGGKSTLFNYLCDGKELSPIGVGGGGIVTSGCRVSAHAVAEGGTEEARIIWRSPKEILQSLGSPLLSYYEKASDCLSGSDVNLDDDGQRRQLENFAWEELKKTSNGLAEKELLRFTLIVCRFYTEFKDRISAGETKCPLEETVGLSSYPQDWKSRWQKVMEQHDLSLFSAKEISFAFIAGIDLYLDSAQLRNLNCSVTDCPGLFASKWDSQIAEKCIREADTILYLFPGDKAMTQEENEALPFCRRIGSGDKIIFGANLRSTEEIWQRIQADAILPTLKEEHGIAHPEIYAFHAGLALRARERFLLEHGWLHLSSQIGLDKDIAQKNSKAQTYTGAPDENRKRYLKTQLKAFLFKLSEGEEDIDDYDITNGIDLEKRSHIQDLILAAKNHIARNRTTGILVDKGTQALLAEIDKALTGIIFREKLMTNNLEEARQQVADAEKELTDFNNNCAASVDAVKNVIALWEPKIKEHFLRCTDQYIDQAMPDFKAAVKASMKGQLLNTIQQGYYDAKAWLTKEKAQQVERKAAHKLRIELGKILQRVAQQVRKQVEADFSTHEGLAAIRKTVESNRLRLIKEIEKLKELPSVADINVRFPNDFSKRAARSAVPDADILFRHFVKGNWYDVVFGIMTAYIATCIQAKIGAQRFEDKYSPEFKECMKDFLKSVLYRAPQTDDLGNEHPAGPMYALKDVANQFEAAFHAQAEKYSEILADARLNLTASDTEANRKLLDSLSGFREKLMGIKQATHTLENAIKTSMTN